MIGVDQSSLSTLTEMDTHATTIIECRSLLFLFFIDSKHFPLFPPGNYHYICMINRLLKGQAINSGTCLSALPYE